MPPSVPQTLTEAEQVGRPYTGNDSDRQKYGFPLQTWDPSTVPGGHICAQYKCVSGWRLVMYCNQSLGCTEVYEVPC
jgi:hypothetical protein